MRRAVLTLGTTAAGLAALLSFKTHSTATADAAAGTSGTPATAASTGPTTVGVPTHPAAPAASTKASASPSSAKASAAASSATRIVTGSVERTPYGPMQVKVTLSGTRITQITVLQETNDGEESQQIDSFSIPELTSEALAAQSAHIDSVSGATQTSAGYIGSLQSALDQAGA